ncbi:MAG: Maf family protein [Balneolaceae bacterium]
MKIILASASPRRKKLLEQINLTFEVCPSPIHEHIDEQLSPAELVQSLAIQKGEDVASKHPNAFIIAADTMVYFKNTFLGKPSDAEEAENMLSQISGKTHKVYSGVYLAETGQDARVKKSFSFSERTNVTFSPLTEQEIKRYIKTGSPFDKAGAYGIQDDMGALFVKRINGDYNNVVGFPLHSFYQNLKSEFPDLIKHFFSPV